MAERRFTRYPINLRLRLKFASGELETTTDEVSLAGFSAPCPNLPEVGTSFGFVVHLPDGGMVAGTAAAVTGMVAAAVGTAGRGSASGSEFRYMLPLPIIMAPGTTARLTTSQAR